ncbi:uncharacterized protein LOC122575231 [Bombus pyrosoma]|uniref:uncharacterized protein LOC122575231 n=1 Tax=Bombus pyrosoma TaxID=396416 RepID=UPI001CB9BBA1|nr:uncharacterized protein LOC122575231 [Bombus pyrosoma]XP_043599851.1 uncharacterized protein LOC122575231 [Bombus pyrosoma]
MASISRGRGRGWALNDKNSLPKPGGSLYADNMIYTNLFNLINRVNNKNIQQVIEDIAKLINENKENLKKIFNKLYSYALDNIDFGMKLQLVCDNSEIMNIYDSKDATLHKYLVNQYQEDYERRKDLKQENEAQFYNRVILFSKFLSCIKHTMKGYYRKLYYAIIDYLEMMLETTSPIDVQFFTQQLIVHGQVLSTICHNKLKDLMIIARQVLLKEDLPLRSRQFLMYAVDLENRNFRQLPKNLQKFYMSQFSENFIDKDKCIVDFLTNMNLKDGNCK